MFLSSLSQGGLSTCLMDHHTSTSNPQGTDQTVKTLSRDSAPEIISIPISDFPDFRFHGNSEHETSTLVTRGDKPIDF